jgi:hypothetical protein
MAISAALRAKNAGPLRRMKSCVFFCAQPVSMSRAPLGTSRSFSAMPRPSGIASDCGVELLLENRTQTR